MTKNSCPKCKKSKNFLEILVSKPFVSWCIKLICAPESKRTRAYLYKPLPPHIFAEITGSRVSDFSVIIDEKLALTLFSVVLEAEDDGTARTVLYFMSQCMVFFACRCLNCGPFRLFADGWNRHDSRLRFSCGLQDVRLRMSDIHPSSISAFYRSSIWYRYSTCRGCFLLLWGLSKCNGLGLLWDLNSP